MVAPLVIAAGVAAASALMQYHQAEKARKASKGRLKEIEEMFKNIVPPDLNISIDDDPVVLQGVPEAAFNLEKITPEQYESVGQYVPEVANFVQETNPQLVEASAEAAKGRTAQMEALERYKEIARSDFDPAFQQQLAAASRKSRTDAQSRSASILQDANRRGQGGSLATMAMQQAESSDAMQRQALESQMAAAESYRNKLSALDRSADLGGNIRASEMGEASRNADIINSFNQRTAVRKQGWADQGAGIRNQGQLHNLGEKQRLSDMNTKGANDAQAEWLARNNAMAQQQFQNRVGERDAGNANDWRNKGLKNDGIRHGNAVAQNTYDNTMAKAASQAGVGYQRSNLEMQSAADRNQAIQGVGNASTSLASSYYSGQRADQKEQRDREWEEEMRRKYPNSY